jgi:transcriptional regulator of acetoin/glycerol metabolism
MNQLSPFVETVIKNYSHNALQLLYQHLKENPGKTVVEGLGCSENEAYVIKRLINATLSREGDIKFNAYFALSTLTAYLPALKERINAGVLADYILSQTNINKHCGGKPS